MTEDIDLEGDADAIAPSADVLLTISRLAQNQLQAISDVQDAEEKLKAALNRLRLIQERDLPDALTAAGVSEFKTVDGVIVTVDSDLSMSIPKARKADCNAWLESNGLGKLVQPTITITLRKGQHNEKAMIQDWLTENGFSYTTEETANTSSVKAAFRKRIEDGKEVDLELFGGHQWKRAIVKLPNT